MTQELVTTDGFSRVQVLRKTVKSSGHRVRLSGLKFQGHHLVAVCSRAGEVTILSLRVRIYGMKTLTGPYLIGV